MITNNHTEVSQIIIYLLLQKTIKIDNFIYYLYLIKIYVNKEVYLNYFYVLIKTHIFLAPGCMLANSNYDDWIVNSVSFYLKLFFK